MPHGAGRAGGAFAELVFRAPTNTTLRALHLDRTVQIAPPYAYGLYALAARMSLSVRAPVTLRRTGGRGKTVSLTGGVSADPRPAEGLYVELQARRGHSWRTFRVLLTRQFGRFHTRYRFLGAGRFALRAIVRVKPASRTPRDAVRSSGCACRERSARRP